MPSLAEDVSIESSSKNGTSMADSSSGLLKIEDGSVISNEHTSKWRVFTDKGREYFMQGNIEQAEIFFLSALQEARKGFGEKDPHVASACNNLAELFRIRKDFDNAEPLYLEAINILEEYFGIDDIRFGAALHNLGQFYLVQRKLERACVCYERALKIKRRVLGELHTEYADTMYHLGTVLHLQGKDKDAEDLIMDSIRILEAGGQGESILCVKKMQHLAQMYTKSNRFSEAEILLRKILHMKELSKNAANMFYIARVKLLIADQLMKMNSSQAMVELDAAKDFLRNSIRVTRKVLVRFLEQKGNKKPIGVPRNTGRDGHSASMILLQSLNALGSLETMKLEFLGSRGGISTDAVAALSECISTFKKLGTETSIYESPQVKAEYLSCLRCLYDLISNGMTSEICCPKDIKDEIQRVEAELSKGGKSSI